MPFIQLEAGVNHTEKTTKVRALVKGGPSLDLDFTAIFSGSGFGVFADLGDLASCLEWRKQQYISLKGHVFNINITTSQMRSCL